MERLINRASICISRDIDRGPVTHATSVHLPFVLSLTGFTATRFFRSRYVADEKRYRKKIDLRAEGIVSSAFTRATFVLVRCTTTRYHANPPRHRSIRHVRGTWSKSNWRNGGQDDPERLRSRRSTSIVTITITTTITLTRVLREKGGSFVKKRGKSTLRGTDARTDDSSVGREINSRSRIQATAARITRRLTSRGNVAL